jgi:dCMP deaminase
MTEWDIYFLGMCDFVRTKSKDPSRKVGSVIVTQDNVTVQTGFNGFAKGVNDKLPERYLRPLKYKFTIHAEDNAVLLSARYGKALNGTIMYCWLFPCSDCANSITQAGIKKVVTLKPTVEENEQYGFDLSRLIFSEAGVELVEIEEKDYENAKLNQAKQT